MSNEHVALVTGANHGIGAAIARALAAEGIAVVLTGLRLTASPGSEPAAYAEHRARSVQEAAVDIRVAGGRVVGVEADLSDPATPRLVFDRAEGELGPVDILVNNASGWRQDTFGPRLTDRHGRQMEPVTDASVDANFLVEGRSAALLIAEYASRRRTRAVALGPDRGAHLRRPGRLPG